MSILELIIQTAPAYSALEPVGTHYIEGNATPHYNDRSSIYSKTYDF